MPRRIFDDDDDLPRRPRRRPRDDDDDYDDRRRARSRNRDDDFDDDEFDRPRRKQQGSNAAPLIAGGIAVGVVVLLGISAAVFYAARSKPAPPAPQPNFAGPAPNPAPVFIPPGVPKDILPPEIVNECVISNLRLGNNGFGGRASLMFDYEFPGGRPPLGERLVAVVTTPNQQSATANLFGLMNAKDSVSIDQIGAFGNSFPRGTTVYIGKGFGAGAEWIAEADLEHTHVAVTF